MQIQTEEMAIAWIQTNDQQIQTISNNCTLKCDEWILNSFEMDRDIM